MSAGYKREPVCDKMAHDDQRKVIIRIRRYFDGDLRAFQIRWNKRMGVVFQAYHALTAGPHNPHGIIFLKKDGHCVYPD